MVKFADEVNMNRYIELKMSESINDSKYYYFTLIMPEDKPAMSEDKICDKDFCPLKDWE